MYYKGAVAGCIGDGDVARWPAYAQALDYELEIGLVLGREVIDQGDDVFKEVGRSDHGEDQHSLVFDERLAGHVFDQVEFGSIVRL